MRHAAGLLTIADLDYDCADKSRVSLSARLGAVLDDGRSVVLLDGRGWTSDRPWSEASEEDIRETALSAAGPDAPVDGSGEEDMAAAYWEYLAEILEREGLDIDPAALRELPHEVRLSQRLRKRIGAAARGRGGATPGR